MRNVISKIIKKRILVAVGILALPVLLSINFINWDVKAEEKEWDVVNDSYSSVEIDKMTVTMSGGEIVITAESKAASKETRIRYQTIGFGVSETYQDVRVRAKGYTGPAAPANVNILYLTEGQKKDLGIDEDGYRKTQFTFSAEAVNEKIGNKLSSITKGKKIYLNAVFQSYYLNDDDSRTIRKGKDSEITSWQEMMEAEEWGSDTLKGFEKYYNCKVGFVPGLQHNYLYYDYPDCDPVYIGKLDDTYVHEMVVFKNRVARTSKSKSGLEYDLSGYKIITRNKDKLILDSKLNIRGDADKIYQIVTDASGKTRTPLGGVDVHIIYNKLPVQDDSYTCNLYYTYNGVKTKVASLPKHKIDDSISISDMHSKCEEKLRDNNHEVYHLVGFNITAIKEGISLGKVTKMTIGVDGKTEENVLGASVKVIKGGINIYLHYTDSGVDIPPPIPSTAPKPTLPPYEYPMGGSASKSLDVFTNVGEIRADIRGQERFLVLQGIPTTESLYTQVRGNEYNISYYFNRKVVEKEYSIRVRKVFNLTWTDAKDKTKIKTEPIPVEQTISVKRSCAYWEIVNFNYYTIDSAVLYNKALPGGSCTMYPDSRYYSPPAATTIHYGSPENHIINPPQAEGGYVIELPAENISGAGMKPTIPPQDFTYEANTMTEEMKVINDYLTFGGTVVLDGRTYTRQAPDLTNTGVLETYIGLTGEDVLYKPNQIIPANILNEVYQSSGTLTYRNHPSAVNSYGSTKDFQIHGLNSVTVHTPVLCDASITTQNTTTGITSNNPYVQVLAVERDCVQLVLDPDSNLSDFTVDINNFGTHLRYGGYYTRDFAWSLRDSAVSYIAKYNNMYRNEVRFPFDVFYRPPSGKEEFIPMNTWTRFGHNTPTFFLPMWVNEGVYTVDFRTIAVNGVNSESQLTKTQTYANFDRSNYVATDTVKVQVSGRIYGLSLYDVSDYPTWETIFRIKTDSARLKLNEGYPSGVKDVKYNEGYSYDYTVGLKDQYGNETGRLERFVLPLVNGSHPKINNVGVLKTGYAVKFRVTTVGNAFNAADTVTVKPRFYYVDAKGQNRREVDVYYNEYFNNESHKLVKVGSPLDQTNIKKYRCGDQFMSIPEKQLQIMSDIKKIDLGKYRWQSADVLTYSTIRISSPLITYVNTDYLLNLKAGDQYKRIQEAGITDTDIVKRMQMYYAEYFLPAEIKLVEKGFDVKGYANKYGITRNESFWLKEGYLIINFDIYTTRGMTKNLGYLNTANAAEGYCSMWKMEGAISGKVSYNGRRDPSTIFEFEPGDFITYYTDKSVKDDYVTYIIN